ncbi:MAG: DUF1840 family protein [Azovibrio sp.]|uniref:DUF1840 family protein n=1 Tax=Azovibrio sp. TaxID=1872673 RepID=UPI003C753E1B
MLVKFISSETGEMVMKEDTARPLLKAMGKACSAQGVITKGEMQPAVEALKRYLSACSGQEPKLSAEEEAGIPAMDRPVGMQQRAWPLINMLNRTAHAKKESHILWEAAADFDAEPETDAKPKADAAPEA